MGKMLLCHARDLENPFETSVALLSFVLSYLYSPRNSLRRAAVISGVIGDAVGAAGVAGVAVGGGGTVFPTVVVGAVGVVSSRFFLRHSSSVCPR